MHNNYYGLFFLSNVSNSVPIKMMNDLAIMTHTCVCE